MAALEFKIRSIKLPPHFLSSIAMSSLNPTIYCVSTLCRTQCEMLKYIFSNPREFSFMQHLKQLSTLPTVTASQLQILTSGLGLRLRCLLYFYFTTQCSPP